MIDSDLVLDFNQARTGPIDFEIRSPNWTAAYTIDIADGLLTYRSRGDLEVLVTTRRESMTLTSFLDRSGLTVLFEDDLTLAPGGMLLRPDRDVPPFAPERLRTIDWDGIDLRKESQGVTRDAASIQARVICSTSAAMQPRDLVIDDDGKGEIADIVAMRIDGSELIILFVHCKFSSQSSAVGARIEDLCEVCGQAQKSARWK